MLNVLKVSAPDLFLPETKKAPKVPFLFQYMCFLEIVTHTDCINVAVSKYSVSIVYHITLITAKQA